MKRLLTKNDRLTAQAADFESLQAQGYTREDYKGLIFWTRTDTTGRSGQILYTLKAYKVNAAHALDFRNYRTEERRAQVIEQYKANHDRREAYKAEVKAQGKPQSNQAQAAQAIREELKVNFKGIKFSVTSEGYSMGDHVNVNWADGPTTDQVEAITGKYQAGHFNGMEDIYEYDKNPANVPQTKYLFCTRSMSEATKATITAAMLEIWPGESWEEQQARERETRKIWNRSPLPASATVTGIDRGDEANNWEERLIYTAPETQATMAPAYEPQEVTAGTIQIIEYSAKAIAVIGDTKPIKDKLNALKGKFNYRLSCGPGWIFPKTRLQEVTEALSKKDETPTPEDIAPEPTEDERIAIAIEDHDYKAQESEVKHYDNLQDIEEAANSGEVIDLMNLHEIVNRPKKEVGQIIICNPSKDLNAAYKKAIEEKDEQTISEIVTRPKVADKMEETANKLLAMAIDHRKTMEVKTQEIREEIRKTEEFFATIKEDRRDSDQRRAGRANTALPAPQMFLSF